MGNFAYLEFKVAEDISDKSNWVFAGESEATLPQKPGASERVENDEFPLGDLGRRSPPDPSPEALAYCQCADGGFTIGKFKQLVTHGGLLIQRCGSRRKAGRGIQELNPLKHDYRRGKLDGDGRHFENPPPKLVAMLKFGVTPDYYGAPPDFGTFARLSI